jgi:hypothetical protein
MGGEPMYDVEGMLINSPYSSTYKPVNTPYQSIVPTASTAGYGGYGGYSTLPAYSYPNGGGNGGE